MNRKLLKNTLMAVFLSIGLMSRAQNVIYSDSFTVGQSYCPNSTQYDKWVTFRAALDTSTNQFLKITVKGTYSTTGRVCADKYVVRKIANSLKNGSNGSYSCNGYTWTVGAAGNCYSNQCGSSSNAVELTVDGSTCSCVGGGWSFRPGITNSNWGGINTNTCGGGNQRMTVEFQKISKPNDMGASAVNALDLCASTQSIIAKLSNFGTTVIDSFRVYYSINGVTQAPLYIKSKLRSGTDTTITLRSSFSLTNNTLYKFKFWTSRPNGLTDSVALNDTFNYTLDFLGSPSPPSTTNFSQCGNGRPFLVATPAVGTDSILWYDASTGGNLLGIGRRILGPYLTATKTFYAQSMKFGGTTNLGTGFGGTVIITGNISQFNGSMFNVNCTKSAMVDSITFKLYNNSANTYFRLYYKLGTHVGFENNSSAWTMVNSGRVRFFTSGGSYYARISAQNLLLAGGNLYGFYITTDPSVGSGNDLYVSNGAVSASNGDITITGNRAIAGLFASQGVYSTWTMNVEFMLKKNCTNSSRAALTVTVKPRPIGADVTKGSVFKGQFRVGDMSRPDVTEVGKKIIYELSPPAGYSNSGHATTWNITSVKGVTRYGVTIPSTDYIATPPSSSGPGTIEFTPTSNYLDSFITFSVTFLDLGPYYCDSTVKRTLVVAPTPKPSFKFPASICLGDAVLFENTTTIHSGNSTYMWYFDDGDSSDLVSPVHEYKQPGLYNIRLVATSFPWGTIKDTTIQVEVSELPTVGFKVNNKCEGLAVTFQNFTIIGNGTLKYDWDFGDNTPHSSAVNPNHLYSRPGGYKVTLTAEANGCKSVLVKNAYTFAKPIPNFLVPIAPVCARTAVDLPNTSTISMGQQGALWRFGDGGISTQFDGKHTYDVPGTYNVKLIAVSEFDCKDSITKTVTIKPTPIPDFSGDLFCGKKPTTFVNTTNEVLPNPIYQWNFSDGYNSTLKNVTRSWPYEGPFSAKLTATYSNGCSDNITKKFNVLIQPKAGFDVQDVCSGEDAIFVNLSTGDRANINYNWNFGDGVFTTVNAPIKSYNPGTTTTYTVSLIASYAGGCSDTARKTLTVSESPVCDFTIKNLGFLKTMFIPGNSSYSSYEWTFGEGGSSDQISPVYQYSYAGNFTVKMKATNAAGCTCEISKRSPVNLDINRLDAFNGFNVYPNPNNGEFTVSSETSTDVVVEVFNVLGEKVYNSSSDNGTVLVKLNDAASGVYVVKVTIAGQTSSVMVTVNN